MMVQASAKSPEEIYNAWLTMLLDGDLEDGEEIEVPKQITLHPCGCRYSGDHPQLKVVCQGGLRQAMICLRCDKPLTYRHDPELEDE